MCAAGSPNRHGVVGEVGRHHEPKPEQGADWGKFFELHDHEDAGGAAPLRRKSTA
jgi:hypothetical protein